MSGAGNWQVAVAAYRFRVSGPAMLWAKNWGPNTLFII